MRLRELKCENCGAMIKVEENVSQVKCEYCQTTFAVEDAYSDGYKFEKGRMKAQGEFLEKGLEQAKGVLGPISKIFATHYIITAVVGIFIFVLIFISIVSFQIDKVGSNFMNSDFIDNVEVSMFNSGYESYTGTEYGSSVGRLIDDIITNNKKDKEHQITIKYNNTKTKEPEKMKEIKKQLDEWTKYEVSFEYDKHGLIYLATIEE